MPIVRKRKAKEPAKETAPKKGGRVSKKKVAEESPAPAPAGKPVKAAKAEKPAAAPKSNAHREAALKLAEMVNKKQGAFTIVTGADTRRLAKVDRIPTGILALDVALGGGLPVGRIIEVYGEEGVGKSTLAQYLCAQVQNNPKAEGKPALYVDVEGALDVDWTDACGANPEDLLLAQPATAEDALDVAEAYARSNSIGAIVIDSIAALEPNEELEKTMSESTVGLQARMISKWLRKVNSALTRKVVSKKGGVDSLESSNKTIILLVNQLRDKVGGFSRPGMPPPQVTSGGKSIRYYASVRIEFKRVEFIKVGDNEVGQTVKFKIIKSKTSKSREVGQFDLYFCDCVVDGVKHYKAEIDNTSALLTLCKKWEIIRRGGSTFYVPMPDGTEEKVKGGDGVTAQEKLEEMIRNDLELQEFLKQRLISLSYDETPDESPAELGEEEPTEDDEEEED